MKKRRGKAITVVLVFLFLAAFAFAAPTKDTLIIAVPGLPYSVDFDVTTGQQTWTFCNQVTTTGLLFPMGKYPYTEAIGDPNKVENFTYPNMDLSKLLPGIVSSVSLGVGGKTATINLRKGVKSAYGNELTADDVLWGVARSVVLKSSGLFFNTLAGAPDASQWKALDKYTIQVTSTQSLAELRPLFTHPFFSAEKFYDFIEIKKHITNDDPWATNWLATHTAGFGAYNLTDWQPGKQAVMDVNPNYYAGPLPFKKIIWEVVPESADRIALLKSGKVDLVEGISPEEAVALSGTAGVNVVSVRGNSELYSLMDDSKAPYSDPRVRTALNMAVPRDEIVKNVYHGMAVAWEGVIPSIYAGYQPVHDYDYNPEKAKSLLAEAGFPNGFSTSLAYSAGEPVLEQVAILYQTSLKRIGVTATLTKLPPAAISDLVFGGKADFAVWSDGPMLADPIFSEALFWWAGSGSIWTKATHYFNSKLDAQMKAANPKSSWNERILDSQQMAQTIVADSPFIFMLLPNFLYATSSHLIGLNWTPGITYVVADGFAWKP